MSSFADGMRAIAGRARRALVLALETGEQGLILNRFVIAAMVLFAGRPRRPAAWRRDVSSTKGCPGSWPISC